MSSTISFPSDQRGDSRSFLPLSYKHRKIVSLIGSLIVSLSAGSNYAYSSFAPQLQESLKLTSTQINAVGITGNMGVYLSGVLWGRWVDKRGPKAAMFTGAVLILCGYGGLSLVYRHAWGQKSALLPAMLNLLTGIGNSGAFTAAMNAQAKSFTGSQRGTATAIVLAGFGLSAFMYSTLSHEFFPGNTEDYLLLLAFGSALSFLTGILLVRIMPPPSSHEAQLESQDAGVVEEEGEEAVGEGGAPQLYRRRTSSDLSARAFMSSDDEDGDQDSLPSAEERRGLLGNGTSSRQKARGRGQEPEAVVDITGRKLLRQTDFQILFLLMCLISGSGLLLINNVGTITRTLWEYNHSKSIDVPSLNSSTVSRSQAAIDAFAEALRRHDPNALIQQEQAHQVSAISVGNASGRIIVGFLSDIFVSWVGSARQRVWLLLPVTILAFASQFVFALPETIDNVKRLLGASFVTGFMYGSLFGIAPCLVFEIWGLRYAALNWGLTSLAPVISGNIFNIVFGRIFDHNVPATSPSHQCPNGEECYRGAFEITSAATALSVLCAVVLIIRRAGLPSLRRSAAHS